MATRKSAPTTRKLTLTKVTHAQHDVHDERLAGSTRGARRLEGRLEFVHITRRRAVAAERPANELVVRVLKHTGDVRVERRLLIAQNLTPRRVVANDADDAELVPRHRVELHQRVARSAIAPQNDDLGVGTNELRANGKAAADAESAKGTGIEPITQSERVRSNQKLSNDNCRRLIIIIVVERVCTHHPSGSLGHSVYAAEPTKSPPSATSTARSSTSRSSASVMSSTFATLAEFVT